jgi:hypothetical protein
MDKIFIPALANVLHSLAINYNEDAKVIQCDPNNYQKVWKGEEKCRQIFEEIFSPLKFTSIRPDFLCYPDTGSNLELDGYNDQLMLGFEYNGRQHYDYTPHFHKDIMDFVKQQERDNWKYKRCAELGIKLIVIPYHIKDLRDFINITSTNNSRFNIFII